MKLFIFSAAFLLSFSALAQTNFSKPPPRENLLQYLAANPDAQNYSAENLSALGKLNHVNNSESEQSANPYGQAASTYRNGQIPSMGDLLGKKFRLTALAPAPKTGNRHPEANSKGLKTKDGLNRVEITFGSYNAQYLAAAIDDSSLSDELRASTGLRTIRQKVVAVLSAQENLVHFLEKLPFSDGTLSESGWHYICRLANQSRDQLICVVRVYQAPDESSMGYAPNQIVEYATLLRVQ